MGTREQGRPISNLAVRVISACIFVPVILWLVSHSTWSRLALVLFIVGRGSWEFFAMARTAGRYPATGPGVGLALAVCLYLFLAGLENLGTALLAVLLLVFSVLLLQGPQNYAAQVLLTLGGALYLGLLGSAPLLIVQAAGAAHRQEVGRLLAVLFMGIWFTDAAAYLCGRRWGRRKLTPVISPGKTTVGFWAGIGGGLLPAALSWLLPSLGFAPLLGLLLVVSLAGQLGDLVESAIKRDLGVKDAPALIPGHGGVLDRFDSYLFAFPAAYLYLEILAIFRSS